MGSRQESITINAHLSSHNSAQDDIDAARWEELRGRIEALLEDERYEDIRPKIL